MSKKSHNEELKKFREAEMQKKAETERKKNKRKVLLTVIVSVAGVLALGLAVLADHLVSSGFFMRRTVAVESEHYKVDNAMMTYYLHSNAMSYANTYSDYLETIGLDLNEDLRNQSCYYSDGSWFDYFLTMTTESVNEMLLYCEEAYKNGISELGEDYTERCDELMASIEESAATDGYTKNEYIELVYGEGVREKDIRNCIKLAYLSSASYDALYQEYNYSDEEIDEYFNKNKADYAVIDYISFTYENTLEEDATDTEMDDEHTKNLSLAEKLSEASAPDEFIAIAKEHSEEASYESLLSQGVSNSGSGSSEEEAFFNEDAKQYDTVIYSEDDLTYTVYMLIKPMYAIDYNTKNVRHILITSSSYDTDEEAKAKADEVMAEFEKDKTEDNFIALAEKYSEDTASVPDGGLYENITLGEMVEEFEDWCYDEARKSGDTDIVKTDYGYHLMYFVSDGNKYYRINVESDMTEAALNADFEALEGSHEITFNEDNFSGING